MDTLKVAGIVTLYNPTDEDILNINTYINDIDVLYVVDNTEGFNNLDRLPKNKKIEYIFNNENVGIATALNIGANKAITQGYDWLLTMDQDTTFNKNVINQMKEYILSNDTSTIGIVTPWHKIKAILNKPNSSIDYPIDVMTSGNLLNLDIYKKIGGFKDWLFIDGVDIEYCLNLRKNGYKILRLNYLEIDHNLGDIFYKKILNRNFLCTNHTAIRRYYIIRNNNYIYDMYKDFDKDFCKYIVSQRHNILAVILFENNKCQKLKYYIKGYIDYKKGIKGKYKN